MAFSQAQWARALRDGKAIYRALELARLAGLGSTSSQRAIHRLLARGWLARIGRGLYANLFAAGGPPSVDQVAGVLYPPAYISLESALFSYGIATQAPQVLTCVTLNKTKRFHTGIGDIYYQHIQLSLFFGWELRDGVPFAQREKAMLDHVYLQRQNGRRPQLDEWSLSDVDLDRLRQLARAFPATVRNTLAGALGDFLLHGPPGVAHSTRR